VRRKEKARLIELEAQLLYLRVRVVDGRLAEDRLNELLCGDINFVALVEQVMLQLVERDVQMRFCNFPLRVSRLRLAPGDTGLYDAEPARHARGRNRCNDCRNRPREPFQKLQDGHLRPSNVATDNIVRYHSLTREGTAQ
jgi:hypothetical protein